jgi:hypothetical protein
LNYTEIDPGGAPFAITPPPVIGEGNHRTLEGVSRPIFLACLPDARVRGRSGCIELADTLLLDFQGDELARLDDRLEFDPTIFCAHGEGVWAVAPKRDLYSCKLDEAFTLLGAHTDAFGHWMWEYLPKYIAASLSAKLPAVPVLIDRHMAPQHREVLELVMPKDVPIIELAPHMTAHVKRLWCAPSQMHMPVLERMNERFKWDYLGSPPSRFAEIVRELARRAAPKLPAETGPERVFLARNINNHRKLINHQVIEAVVEARGFRIIRPETLSFVEQARLLRDARFIAGPEGSAFFQAIFAKPGTQVCILDHPHTAGLPLLTELLSEVGIESAVFTGRFVQFNAEWPHLSDYDIDEIAFAQFLDDWLQGEAP